MISASDLIRQSNPFESSIQQILRLDGLKREQLRSDLNNIESQKKALNDIGSAFSSFQTILNKFSDETAQAFRPLKTESTFEGIQITSNNGIDNTGSFDVQVTQMARRDTMTSASFATDGTALSANGTGSFEITVGGGDPITISLDTTGLTNDEVLSAIRDAVNNQAGDRVSASRIQTSDTESALSLKSRDTGSNNQISIANIQGDFQNLNLDRLFDVTELDARFSIDGIEMTRSSNVVENAIEGVTFEITGQTGSGQINITKDTEAAVSEVEGFIESFNKLNSEIRSKTFIDGETGNRGILQRERSLRNLSINMRQSLLLPVSGLSDPGVQSISDIGISISQEGSLSIDDAEKLETFLTTQPELIEQFFTGTDGIVQRLKNSVELSLSGDNNLLDNIENALDSRIDRTNDRIDRETRFLERREEQLRSEFSRLQQVIDDGERQFNQVLNFQAALGFNSF